MALEQYKIVLVGDGFVGKTKWVNKLLTLPSTPQPSLPPSLQPLFGNDYSFVNGDKYVPTLGVEVHPIHVNTNKGLMVFNIWDCAGQDKYGGLRDGYYILSHGAIVMWDSTNQESGEHVGKWAKDVYRVCNKNNLGRGHLVRGDDGDIRVESPNEENEYSIEEWSKGSFPMVGVATKCDNGIYPPNYIGISTKENLNLMAPLLALVRKIKNDDSIVFL